MLGRLFSRGKDAVPIFPRLLVAVAMAAAALAVLPGAASAREVPVGLWGVANNPIRDGDDLLATRFVLDEPTTMYRFLSGFNLEGVYTDESGAPAPADMRTRYLDKRTAPGGDPRYAPPPPVPSGWSPGSGRIGYAHGDGGIIHARLVRVKPSGEPDMSQVLAEEKVNAVQRYRESKAEYRVSGKTQLLHFNLGGVRLEADTPYAVVFSNASPDPYMNYFSTNLPAAKLSVAGPNARNTMDKNAPGAVAGLDPRESVSWSRNSGGSWAWGTDVGSVDGGPYLYGYYGTSAVTDDGPKLPWYGWQTGPSAKPQSNQPYYAYAESGSYTLRAGPAPRATTLTEAGGYAPHTESVGAVTVRNTTTGETGRTSPLGEGMPRGRLDNPVRVEAGQTYEISNSGTVLKAEADSFIVSTFGVGSGDWPFQTVGHGADRAELFALPHPWWGPRTPQSAPPVQLKAEAAVPVATVGRGGQKRAAPQRVSAPPAVKGCGASARLKLRGRVARSARRRVRSRAVIQLSSGKRWRTVARVSVRRNGSFKRRVRTRIKRCGRGVRVRAVVPGAGRSKNVPVRVRRLRGRSRA